VPSAECLSAEKPGPSAESQVQSPEFRDSLFRMQTPPPTMRAEIDYMVFKLSHIHSLLNLISRQVWFQVTLKYEQKCVIQVQYDVRSWYARYEANLMWEWTCVLYGEFDVRLDEGISEIWYEGSLQCWVLG
jgi:hypothetical protein